MQFPSVKIGQEISGHVFEGLVGDGSGRRSGHGSGQLSGDGSSRGSRRLVGGSQRLLERVCALFPHVAMTFLR